MALISKHATERDRSVRACLRIFTLGLAQRLRFSESLFCLFRFSCLLQSEAKVGMEVRVLGRKLDGAGKDAACFRIAACFEERGSFTNLPETPVLGSISAAVASRM